MLLPEKSRNQPGQSNQENVNDLKRRLEEEIILRKQLEDKLKKTEEKFSKLFYSSNNAAFIYQHNRLIDCNDKALKLLSASKDQLLGLHPWDFSPEYQPDGTNSKEKGEQILDEINRDEPWQFEWQHTRMNGETLDVEVNLNIINLEEEMFMATFWDITDRKKQEQALKESEERYKRLSEATFEAILILKGNKLIDVNDQIEQIFGYSAEEFIHKKLEEFIHPDDLNLIISKNTDNTTTPFVHRGIKNDGSILYLEVHPKIISINNEKHRLIVIKDITHYKEIEISLKRSEEKFRNIFNSVSEAIYITDLKGQIQEVNTIAVERDNYTKNVLTYSNINSFIVPTDSKKVTEYFKNINSPGFSNLEAIHQKKHGSRIPVEVNAKLITYKEKNAIIIVSRDISERKHMQRQLYKAMVESEERERERYATELHDGLGPILSTCKIYFYSLKVITDKIKHKQYVDRAGELLEDALQTIKEISNNLSPHILRNYGLTQALHSFGSKLALLPDTKINIVSELQTRHSEIIEFTLYRSLVELINNSVKHSKASIINVHLELKDNNDIHIDFSDNGIGFEYEQLKRNSNGFGLLNLEHRIQEIGGEYSFSSKPGKGVQIKIVVNDNLE
jgi:PAS domain S-box-containing protein